MTFALLVPNVHDVGAITLRKPGHALWDAYHNEDPLSALPRHLEAELIPGHPIPSQLTRAAPIPSAA